MVDPWQRRGADEAQPSHLHRRRPQREDALAHACAQSMQVHQDIDLTVEDALRCLRIAQVRDGLEMLKCRLQALTVRTAVLDAVAEGKYLDATAVMLLEQVGQQQSDRMGAQISRQIADPQARMMVAATRRQRSRRGRQLSGNI